MPDIPLPGNKGAGTQDAPVQPTPLEQKVANLTDQIGELNKQRREEDASRANAEATAAEEERQAQLKAESDLAALLDRTGEASDKTPVSGASRTERINDLSNADMLDTISTAVETAINAKIEQAMGGVDAKIKGTSDSVEKICTLLGQMQASSGLEKARSSHPDFETFKPDVLEVLKIYPNVSIEHAYQLAKTLRKGNSPSVNETAFERETNAQSGGLHVTPSTEGRRSGTELPAENKKGLTGFRNIIDKGMDVTLAKYE